MKTITKLASLLALLGAAWMMACGGGTPQDLNVPSVDVPEAGAPTPETTPPTGGDSDGGAS